MKAFLSAALVLMNGLSGMATAQAVVGMAALNATTAKAVGDVAAQSRRDFKRVPLVRLTVDMMEICGGGARANLSVRYCTSQNAVYVAAKLGEETKSRDMAAYLVAHALAHGVQVRNGIADVALSKIRANRPREAELRGMVTRQVECIAGVMYARAGYDRAGDLTQWFADEPFTGRHWGRDPLKIAPRVSIGLAARNEWFRIGRDSQDYERCAVGEMGSELLVKALN